MLASEEMIKSLLLNHTEWTCQNTSILLLVITFYIKHSSFSLKHKGMQVQVIVLTNGAKSDETKSGMTNI